MRNKEALDALEEFEKHKNKLLPFKLKYSFGKNILWIKELKILIDSIKNISDIDGINEFLAARQLLISQNLEEKEFREKLLNLESKYPDIVKVLVKKETEYKQFLNRDLDNDYEAKVFKINPEYFPDNTDIDISVLMPFIDEKGSENA